MKILAKIRYYIGAFIISSIVALIMIPLLFVAPKHSSKILHHFNKLIVFLLGGKVEEIGRLDPDCDMVLINHQGIIDIIAMESVECIDFRWVAKKELFDTPWFGYLLKHSDMICIDRDDKRGLLKLLKDAKETSEYNRIIAIFPEGTRSSDQNLLPFKAGAAMVAKRLKLKVQPIVITGSKRLLNEHNYTAHNSTVKIIYLDPINVAGNNKEWYSQLSIQMQNAIDEEYNIHSRER
ncbi:MAG: 1-acyl-sn-glycerol-3-phosphate acyltransferase [Sulfurovum sp.]|nr:1-acyl-sn-glycerol-3-phosphate acyltransferase [Sulfurovum sp.]